jgi:hypothetical protein
MDWYGPGPRDGPEWTAGKGKEKREETIKVKIVKGGRKEGAKCYETQMSFRNEKKNKSAICHFYKTPNLPATFLSCSPGGLHSRWVVYCLSHSHSAPAMR